MSLSYLQFYNDNKALIDKHYLNFNKVRNKVFAIYGVFYCIFIFIAFYLHHYFYITFNMNFPIRLIIFLLLVLAFILLYFMYITLKKDIVVENDKLINEIIIYLSHDKSASFQPNKQISKDNIKEMGLFNFKTLKYSGKNAILVNYKNNEMSFGDMSIYYLKTNNSKNEKIIYTKKYIFDGIYISATLNKKIAENIYMIPKNITDLFINSKIEDYILFPGDEVELENLDISKKYKVFSKDEIQARYILSLSLMEKINNIDNELPGKKYIVFKEGKRFVICLEGFKIEDLRKELLPIFRNEKKELENIKYVFTKLNKLFNIYDILDLGNNLYVN